MKVLSRFVSPAGFGLVVLLFFLLPFMSVSCDLPSVGEVGASYYGSDMIAGSQPTPVVPDEFREFMEQGSAESENPDPAPEVGSVAQILSILTVVLAVLGLLTVLIAQAPRRQIGATGIAVIALGTTIATFLVAKSRLESALLADADDADVASGDLGLGDIATRIGDFIHTEVGFWLVAMLLGMIAVLNVGLTLIPQRPAPQYGFGPPPPQPSPPVHPPAEQPPPGGSP